MEKVRINAIAAVPPAVLFALAAQEFARKVERIDSLNVSPDMLASLAQQARLLMTPQLEK